MGNPANKNPERVRTRYTKEFKLEALRLLSLGQKPATQIATELGIRRNQLYKWAEELKRKGDDTEAAFSGPPGRPAGPQGQTWTDHD
jgi:transposase